MSPGDDFSNLLERVRHGESDAAIELVNHYESTIRVAVRIRLTDPGSAGNLILWTFANPCWRASLSTWR